MKWYWFEVPICKLINKIVILFAEMHLITMFWLSEFMMTGWSFFSCEVYLLNFSFVSSFLKLLALSVFLSHLGFCIQFELSFQIFWSSCGSKLRYKTPHVFLSISNITKQKRSDTHSIRRNSASTYQPYRVPSALPINRRCLKQQ